MPATDRDLLNRIEQVREVLMYTFDFELLVPALAAEAYAVPSPWVPAFNIQGATYSIVARDATAGVYVSCELLGAQRSCALHVDTQGHAAALGEDLGQALALILALPYWREILQQTTGKLHQMRELAQQFEHDVSADFPALAAARNDLLDCLPLPAVADPVERLHELAVVSPAPVSVVSPHGWQYQSLVHAAI